MRTFCFWGLFFVMALNVSAQTYVLEKSVITFFSDAVIEDITAKNEKSNSLFNIRNFEIAFSVPIREFQFEKKLMQEHFNEKYMESVKFPKATFSGKILSFDSNETETQKITAEGRLTIHGVTKEVTMSGTGSVRDNKLVLISKFTVRLSDYKIQIPKLMWQNIAEEVEVSVEFTYKPK